MESKTIKYKYDFLNPVLEDNPDWKFCPAFRGENQMCIYTYDYQLKTSDNYSGVNPWGMEAAVDKNGIVIELSDRCLIPEGGYVISGNSKAHYFIKDNIKLGAFIKLDTINKFIEIEVNEIKTGLYTLKVKLEEIKSRYETAKKYFYLMNDLQVDSTYEKLKELFAQAEKESDLKQFRKIYKKFFPLYEKMFYMTTKVSCIRSVGFWSRPNEKNLQEIIDLLELMKKNNFNTLYVESFYNGGVAGKSKITNTVEEAIGDYGIYGDDYLLALISEAHKRNIEVHAWVENFFVGESIRFDKNYPDYFRMVNYDGSTVQGHGGYNTEVIENGFIFLDPAHPETHKYVLSIYEELLNKYDIDGLNIDYIRYPHGNYQLKTSNGYTEYAMTEFKKIYGFSADADVRKLVEDEANLKLWTEYRCGKITLLMQEIRELVDRVKPNCLISMAVVPETDYAIKNKMQNWVPWVQNGWIDITLPMAYYFGSSEVSNATKNLVAFNNNRAFSYTGISPSFEGALNFNSDLQIEAVYQNGAQGFAIFSIYNLMQTSNINQKYLHDGILRINTTQPHDKSYKVVLAYINEFEQKYPKIIKYNYENKNFNVVKQASLFVNRLYDLYICCKNDHINYSNILNELHLIKAELNIYFIENAYETIWSDLSYLENVLTIQGRKFL